MKTDAFTRDGLVVNLVLTAFITLASCQSQQPTRILFIGNSYTAVNGGLDKQLEKLSPSIETERVALGGYTLEKHWTDSNAVKRIRDGKWNYVVLQEQSQVPVINRQMFYRFARMFDEEIRRSGAQTILLMTWERPDSRDLGVTTEGLETAYDVLGKELGAKVAPAGLAFARSYNIRPGLALCVQDGHPTVEGTYLAASVLYRTIFDLNPAWIPSPEGELSEASEKYLLEIAADSSMYLRK